tara:strand:- start:822 stop:1568 length:747 start_codon:yes stop_codon:yes gene_type:complete
MSCIAITFGDCSENHVGMEKMGNISAIGYSSKDLDKIANHFSGKVIERIDLTSYLGDETYVGERPELLIIRNAIQNHSKIFIELNNLEWDAKYFDTRRQKVLNKHARTNLCFSNYSQKADFENKKGTIISYDEVPELNSARKLIMDSINEKNLECEGNNYHNINKNGIGWHGDAERKKVIALRLGETMPICFNWFKQCKPIGTKFIAQINSGDIYVMSEKTTGYDWKKRSIYTLRHSAGADKYTKLPN